MKKLAIIGKGTAGCLAAGEFRNSSRVEIDWYFNPQKPAQAVGEGSVIGFPDMLRKKLDWFYDDLKEIDGTFKHGIRKVNWGGNGDFFHPFPLSSCGLHFNANKLQEKIINKLSSKVNFIEKSVINHSEIDADYIIDCSGKPDSYEDYNQAKSIPLNAAYVVQGYWDNPTFDYTLTMARPYGWVFGIPLTNRCSVGYLYNSNINSEEEVKEDIKEVFKFLKIKSSNTTNSLKFNNYYRKQNFTERVAYNGNSSFFLEPLEATSIGVMQDINFLATEHRFNNLGLNEINGFYNNKLKEIEFMISLHYLAGSQFKTDFWEYAQGIAEENFHNNISDNWKEIYNKVKEYKKVNIKHQLDSDFNLNHAQWSVESYNFNITGLNLFNKIDKLLNI